MKDCCIIIPIYNIQPTENEILSIKRTASILSGDYDTYYVCSDKLDLSCYKDIADLKVQTFSDKYFKSNKTYSRLLLSEKFYNAFMSYEFMLIAQTDTYIVNTNYRFSDFLGMGYDYIGGLWENGPFFKPYTLKDRIKLLFVHNPSKIHVGNGGFSLRNVKQSFELAKRKRYYIAFLWRFNEDLFFSNEAYKYCRRIYDAKAGSDADKLKAENDGACIRTVQEKMFKYIAAPADVAKQFALEANMKEEIENGNIPFAVHAFEKYYPELPKISSNLQ